MVSQHSVEKWIRLFLCPLPYTPSMDPYATDGPADGDEGPDPDEAVPGLMPKLAGVSLILAGVFVAGSGAQLLFFFVLYRWWTKASAIAMVLLGTSALGLGGAVFQARDWATGLGIVLSGTLALGMTGWVIYALSQTLFSPMMLLGWLCSGLSLLLVAMALPSAITVSRARRDLYR